MLEVGVDVAVSDYGRHRTGLRRIESPVVLRVEYDAFGLAHAIVPTFDRPEREEVS